jgi:hypothetical protein
MDNLRNNGLNTHSLFNTTLFSPQTKYRIQEWVIPGMTMNHIQQQTKVGIVNLQGDIMEYNDLEIKLLVDENLSLWKEIVGVLQTYHKPGTNICETTIGDAWVEVYDSKNKYLFRINFKNCYIKSLEDLRYLTTDDNEVVTVGLILIYDYYVIE